MLCSRSSTIFLIYIGIFIEFYRGLDSSNPEPSASNSNRFFTQVITNFLQPLHTVCHLLWISDVLSLQHPTMPSVHQNIKLHLTKMTNCLKKPHSPLINYCGMPFSLLPAPQLWEKPSHLLKQSRGLLWTPRPLLSDESALRRNVKLLTEAAILAAPGTRVPSSIPSALFTTSLGCSKAPCLWKKRRKINPDWWEEHDVAQHPQVLLPQRRNERQAEHENYSDFAIQEGSHCRPLESHRPGGLRRNGRLWLPLPNDTGEDRKSVV